MGFEYSCTSIYNNKLSFVKILFKNTHIILLSSLLMLVVWLFGFNDVKEEGFTDCEGCPEMVIVPAGEVLIGSDQDEIGRKKGERNRIKAVIKAPFAMATTEVTLGQFRVFMEETRYKSKIPTYKGEPLVGCNYFDGKGYGYIAGHNWQNPGYPQREDAPVVCVSWSDAAAYVAWLSEKTGRTYRIPSAVEFEYASRAGSSAPWFWGTDPAKACDYANIGDRTFVERYPKRPAFPCNDGYVYTAPVKQFKSNAFGLYDMVGNAWEWTNDCFISDLGQTPADGSSQLGSEKECGFRTPKGGSWISGISWSRAAVRSKDGADYKSFMLGFRVAATLNKE